MSFLRSKLLNVQAVRAVVRRTYMEGAGGRSGQNKLIQGMTMSSLKHHVALQPLFVVMAFAILFCGSYVARLAIYTTDVSFTKEEQPYEYYRKRQFKMLNPSNIDYDKACQAPKYVE